MMPRTILLLTTSLISAPAFAQETTLLAPIVVSSYETEGVDSYASDRLSVGEKEALSQREIPQSSTVITRKRIEDAGYTALETALQDTPGLLILDNDVGRSSIYSRGFEFDYLYFDGLPSPVASVYGTQPDLSIVDHVEVLKGPSGLFTGTGEPAGAINMRLKQAQAERSTTVRSSLQSEGAARVEVDTTGALNASGTLRGRAVLTYGDGDTYVDGTENGVKVGYGTVAWDITPDTTLTFSVARMERDISPFNGLPTYSDGSLLDMDPRTTTGTDWNRFNNRTTDYTAALEHRLQGGGLLKFSARYSDQSADFLYAYAGSAASADNTVSSLAYLGRKFTQESLALDAFASLPFTLGGMDANIIVGVDYQHVDSRTLTARGRIAGTFDLDDWDTSSVSEPDADYSTRVTSDYETWGTYTQLRLRPTDKLTIIGGARATWYRGEATDLTTGEVTGSQNLDGEVTPYAGLTYDLNDAWTLYASYTGIFQPQTETDADGDVIDPREGRQFELGAKADLGQGLHLTAALFDLRDRNRAQTVLDTDYYAATGDVSSRGFETELLGEVGNWKLAGGYTYTRTEYLNGEDEGDAFSTYTPKHMVKATADYSFEQGRLAGLSLGAGVVAMSSFSSNGIEAPGYAVFNLGAGYEFDERTSLRMNVGNLFDRDYYERVGSTSVFNFYGAPRNVSLTLTSRF